MEVTSTKKQIWTMGSYSLLTLSIMVGFMYLNTFATEVLKIDAKTLANALLVAKVIDFCVSLFAGMIIETARLSKTQGKNQSWLNVGRWILAVCIMLEVCNTTMAPKIVSVVVLAASYTMLNSLMNIIQTAYYGALAAVAGPNMANRSAMTVNMTRQSTVIAIICAFIPTLVSVLPFGNYNYFVVATVFMLPMPFALGAIAKCAGEAGDPPATGAKGGIGIGYMFGTLFANKQMLILFSTFTVLYIGNYIYMANYTYYWIYVVGNFSLLTVASLCASCVGLVAAMIMPKVGAKLGKKNACVFGFSSFAAGLIILSFVGKYSWILYIVCMAVTSFGTYTYTPYAMLMFIDCGEYYLWKTGKDTRAIAAGLASPPMKIGMALGGTIGLYLLAATGFAQGFTPTPEWIDSFMRVTFLVPGIVYAIAAVMMLTLYKISDADAAKYAKENAERMMAK